MLGWITTVAQPSKTQFEAERAVLLQRIKNIQQVLLQTETKKREGMGQLNALNTQIESNALLIQTIGQELSTINQEIQQRQRTVARLAQELAQLQKEYAAMVYVASKALHDIHTLMFIFAAPSFYNLVQRLRYVKQYARIRQKHFLEIEKTTTSCGQTTYAGQESAATQQASREEQAEQLKNKTGSVDK